MAQFLVISGRDYDNFPLEAFAEHLGGEVARVRELYAGGHLRFIWSRADHGGAVALLEAGTEDEAREIWGTLPLVRKGMVQATIVSLAPYHGFARVNAEPSGREEDSALDQH